MSASESLRVVVIEDHEMVRVALRESLDHEPDIEVVGQASNGQDALELVRTHRPDVIVTDYQLGDEEAPHWIERFLEVQSGCAILVLTGWPAERPLLRSLDAGALGFLSKAQPMQALVDGVRRVAAGETVIAPEFIAVLARRSAGTRSDPAELSRRELEILTLISRGCGTDEIAASLGISRHTVRNHVSNVMMRLGVHSRLEAVSEAVRRGIISPQMPR